MGAPRRRRFVYAAHPMTTYGTAIEKVALAQICKLLPESEIINPADRYVDSVHWQSDWPQLLPTLSALVVFGDEDGSIGTGCLRELADAWWWDIPVAMLDGIGDARSLSKLAIRPGRMRDPCRTASLVPGGVVDLARLIGKAGAGSRSL